MSADTLVLPRVPKNVKPEEGKRRRIPEIEGLRGLAIALIVVYHLWFDRVSGGVDVFLLLSGFLITGSLLGAVERGGKIEFGRFYSRITRRIVPPAFLVLVGALIAAVLWLPQSRWSDTWWDIVASAFYVQNWRLAENAVDYLAAQNSASVVQHYWSLAIQGQFYLLWPLVIAAVALISKASKVSVRTVAWAAMASIFVASLTFSVYSTSANQAYAYFDTRARLWEFALGGLLVLVLPYLSLGRRGANTASWLGLGGLVLTGVVFTGDEFPGYAALLPTVAAAALIAAAHSRSDTVVRRLLRASLIQKLGEISYALFLWHWPVLIYYLAASGNSSLGLRGGALVIACSVVLAIATRWLIELRLPATGLGQRTVRGGFALGGGALVIVLTASLVWYASMAWERNRIEQLQEHHADSYLGAAWLEEAQTLPEAPIVPDTLDAALDRMDDVREECHQDLQSAELITCEFGAADADTTITMVGASRVWHWLPAMVEVAENQNWRVVTMVKSSCLFTTDDQISQGQPYTSCYEWLDSVTEELEGDPPDLVFTTGTRVGDDGEILPDGYLERWQQLEDLGINIAAIRDTPRVGFDVPECVDEHGPQSQECGRPRDDYYPRALAEVLDEAELPSNIDFIDLTDYLCEPEFCPAVIGNVLVYRDNTHLTATYVETMAPYLEAELAQL